MLSVGREMKAGMLAHWVGGFVLRLVLVGTATVWVASGLDAQQGNAAWVKDVEAARPAVVVIETEQAQGSGFIVKPDGVLLTNEHVIAGAKEITVKLASGETYRRAFLLASDSLKDIAILSN